MSRVVVARRVLFGLLAVVVVVALVATVVVVSTVRASLPTTSGSAQLPGLTADVTVMRDGSGIPHIFGDTLADLARAQGYVHAQEQFFQMDLRRHITAGRLSELVGADGVETDTVIRTMGWRRIAEEELPTLKPQTRQMLQAYADGVNTYLRGRSPREVSLEYTVLGLQLPTAEIEEWTPVDSLSWLKAMAWDLKGNYADELARARLSGRLSPSQINQIYPAYDDTAHPPILSDDEWSPQTSQRATQSAVPSALTTAAGRARTTTADAGPAPKGPAASPAPDGALTSASAQQAYAAVQAALDSVPQLVGRGEGVGSNSWVVSGAHTTTGKPLLANDPHLGVSQPGIWIQNSLSCRTVTAACPMQVSGFSFAGVPGVVIGHNADIAWGFTNLGPDVTDFFLERVVGDTYLRDGSWQPVTTRQETIKVAGGSDRTVTIRSTVHGPVMSDVVEGLADAGARAPTEQEGD
ncbi:MAG: penicillin acylase family protein, partial [Ornithinibacter sp.]